MSRTKARTLLTAAAVLVVSLAGCSSGGGGGGGSDSVTIDTAGAQAVVDPYVGQPGEFPISDPLTQRPPAGTKVVLVQTGTPAGNLFFDLMKPAAAAMGIELTQVVAGTTSQAVNAAMDSVVELAPQGVIDIAVDPALFPSQLDKLRSGGTVVVGVGLSNGDEYGFDTVQYGTKQQALAGQLMAAWALTQAEPGQSQFVMYTVPELTFLKPMVQGVQDTIDSLCEGCDLRVVDIPVAQLGNTAPQTVVADLQAHPDTAYAIFAAAEITTGLPAALDVAGLDIPTIGDGPLPVQLQYIQDGQQAAGLGTDLGLVSWMAIDQFARQLAGQELTGTEADGISPKQVLRQEDLGDADLSGGWVSYPDYQDRFRELWGLS